MNWLNYCATQEKINFFNEKDTSLLKTHLTLH